MWYWMIIDSMIIFTPVGSYSAKIVVVKGLRTLSMKDFQRALLSNQSAKFQTKRWHVTVNFIFIENNTFLGIVKRYSIFGCDSSLVCLFLNMMWGWPSVRDWLPEVTLQLRSHIFGHCSSWCVDNGSSNRAFSASGVMCNPYWDGWAWAWTLISSVVFRVREREFLLMRRRSHGRWQANVANKSTTWIKKI